MKNLKAIILGLVATGSIFLGSNKVSVSAQEVTTVQKESYKIEEQKEITYNDFKIIDTYVNSVNSTIIEFNDGSSAILNASQDLYEFYQTDLGDWGTKGDSREDLINIIKTYMELRFNMSEEQINNHDNFKNANLVGHVETFENEKEIIEVVEKVEVNEVVEEVQEEVKEDVKEDVKEVQENEFNETIEKNENVEKVEVNEVVEEDTTEIEEVEDTTEEVVQDLQPIENDKTLEENIKEYIEYRNNLINEYGEEVYNKMNEEAGITTEEESFLQFVEYGI